MKKIFLSILLSVFIVSIALSQDSLKVYARHLTTEVNINPFNGQLSLNNAINQIKFRYFTDGNTALRLGLAFNSRKISNDANNPYGPNPVSSTDTKKTRTIGLSFGFETHFKGTSRLSPYFGAELSLVSKKSSQTIKGSNYQRDVDGAWEVFDNQFGGFEERGYFSYGVNLITGFDFYIAKHLFLGYELTFGLSKLKYKDIDVKTRNSSVPGPTDTSDNDESEFRFGASLVNGIRIGYVF